jgi:hypothetical protein
MQCPPHQKRTHKHNIIFTFHGRLLSHFLFFSFGLHKVCAEIHRLSSAGEHMKLGMPALPLHRQRYTAKNTQSTYFWDKLPD